MPSLVAAVGLVLVIAALATDRDGTQPLPRAGAGRSAGGGGAAGRVLFAFVPNVQPLTMVVAVTGVCARPASGIGDRRDGGGGIQRLPRAGAMDAMADAGLGAGGSDRRDDRRSAPRTAGCWPRSGSSGDSALTGSSTCGAGQRSARQRTPRHSPPTSSAGIWFDIAHATGNAVIALVAGPALIRTLDRYAQKLHGTFVPLEHT